jgi:hypothetical protein
MLLPNSGNFNLDRQNDAAPARRPDPGAWVWGAYQAHAGALARWALARLVNRTDAWGSYRPPEEWDREYVRQDGTTGKLGQTTTRKGRLTEAVLARHFRAADRADLVGLHSTSPDNTSRWGGLDIDWHDPTSTAPAVNLRAALAWYDWLAGRGFRPLLTDSNGAGGYHLLVLLAEAISTARLYHFLRRLVADHSRHGMTRPPETFPKQPALRPKDGRPAFGNWLRLPGRHHTHAHWSRVWDGGHWLSGAGAVAFLLALAGDDPALVPDVPPEPAPPVTAARRCRPFPAAGDNRAARAAAYLARLPNLGEGQGRDDVAYQFGAFLARDLDLADDVALDWLCRWDAGNAPPKGRERLAEVLNNARRYGRRAAGCGLADVPRPAPGRVRVTDRGRGHYLLTISIEVR